MSNRKKAELVAELVEAVRANQNATDKMDEAAAQALGINRTDHRCMDVVERRGSISAGELASEAGLTTGTMTAVVDRLEAKGYLRRVDDSGDRRRVLIELTELAKERAWQLYAPLAEAVGPITSRYTMAELEAMADFMRRGTELVERRAAEIRAELAAASAEPAEARASSRPAGRALPAVPSAARLAPPAS